MRKSDVGKRLTRESHSPSNEITMPCCWEEEVGVDVARVTPSSPSCCVIDVAATTPVLDTLNQCQCCSHTSVRTGVDGTRSSTKFAMKTFVAG